MLLHYFTHFYLYSQIDLVDVIALEPHQFPHLPIYHLEGASYHHVIPLSLAALLILEHRAQCHFILLLSRLCLGCLLEALRLAEAVNFELAFEEDFVGGAHSR